MFMATLRKKENLETDTKRELAEASQDTPTAADGPRVSEEQGRPSCVGMGGPRQPT